MSLSLSRNNLLLNEAALSLERITPNELRVELNLARVAITNDIHDYYHFMRAKYPDNTIDPYVPVNIMSLGDADRVLTSQGQDNNTSLHYEREEISEEFRDYFDEIALTSFVPFVRSRLYLSKKHPNGTRLSLTTKYPIESN